MTLRVDLAQIADWITPGSRVLDLGCGDGTLLAHLRDAKDCRGYGVELNDEHVAHCVRARINVVQQNLDAGLRMFDDDMFDTVVLSQTLQAMHNAEGLLREMARVGREGVVSFPNFGHWRHAVSLLAGRMPVTQAHSVSVVRHAEHPPVHAEGLRDPGVEGRTDDHRRAPCSPTARRSTFCPGCVPRWRSTASRPADPCGSRARRVYLPFQSRRGRNPSMEAVVSEELRRKLIRNFDEVEFETSDRAPLYDGGRSAGLIGPAPGPAGTEDRLRHRRGAAGQAGVSVSLPLRAGRGLHRARGRGHAAGGRRDGPDPARRRDLASRPARTIRITSSTLERPLKYLSLSTREFPEICEYPDSGKYMAYTQPGRTAASARGKMPPRRQRAGLLGRRGLTACRRSVAACTRLASHTSSSTGTPSRAVQ